MWLDRSLQRALHLSSPNTGTTQYQPARLPSNTPSETFFSCPSQSLPNSARLSAAQPCARLTNPHSSPGDATFFAVIVPAPPVVVSVAAAAESALLISGEPGVDCTSMLWRLEPGARAAVVGFDIVVA